MNLTVNLKATNDKRFNILSLKCIVRDSTPFKLHFSKLEITLNVAGTWVSRDDMIPRAWFLALILYIFHLPESVVTIVSIDWLSPSVQVFLFPLPSMDMSYAMEWSITVVWCDVMGSDGIRLAIRVRSYKRNDWYEREQEEQGGTKKQCSSRASLRCHRHGSQRLTSWWDGMIEEERDTNNIRTTVVMVHNVLLQMVVTEL